MSRGEVDPRFLFSVVLGDANVLYSRVEANYLCSDDRTGFPVQVMASLGIELVTSDALLSALIDEAPETMLGVHRAAVAGLKGATDESTIGALRAANATRTAALMAELLGVRG